MNPINSIVQLIHTIPLLNIKAKYEAVENRPSFVVFMAYKTRCKHLGVALNTEIISSQSKESQSSISGC